jgi:hypothetical protein
MADKNFKKILMGNTNIKILGRSTNENYKELSTDFGISVDQLQLLPEYYFYVKVGHGQAFRIKGRGGLIKDKNSMSMDMWEGMVVQQLKNYYVPENAAIEEKRRQEEMRGAAQGSITNREGKQNTDTGTKPKRPAKQKDEPPKDAPPFSF